MGYLIIGFIAIVIIVLLFILASYIAFFLLMILSVWYLARQLWRQLHRHRPIERLWPVFLVAGVVSILIAVKVEMWMILRLFVPAFTFTFVSVVGIELWNFKSKKVPLSRLYFLRERERSLNRDIEKVEMQIQKAQGKIAAIEDEVRDIIEQKTALEDRIAVFCMKDDVAVWDMRRRKLEDEYSQLNDKELDQVERDVGERRAQGQVDEKSAVLLSYVVQLERLSREMRLPQAEIDENQAMIRQFQREIDPLRRQRDRVRREKELYERDLSESTKTVTREIGEDIRKDYTRFREFCSRVYERWSE